jgi:deoxyribodipyrimidine photolyase
MMHSERIFEYKKAASPGGDYVVYWMGRDQRAEDNWALIYAYEKAREMKKKAGRGFLPC